MNVLQLPFNVFTPAKKFNPIINLFFLKELALSSSNLMSAALLFHYIIDVNL